MDWIVRPIRAVLFADEQAFLWIRKKLGLTEYGMAALVWVKGLIIGFLWLTPFLMLKALLAASLVWLLLRLLLPRRKSPRLKVMTSAHWDTSTPWHYLLPFTTRWPHQRRSLSIGVDEHRQATARRRKVLSVSLTNDFVWLESTLTALALVSFAAPVCQMVRCSSVKGRVKWGLEPA